MVAVTDCLDGLVLSGRMSQEQAKQVSDMTERLQERYAETMTQSAAERAAAERAAKMLTEQKALAKRQRALQALKAQENADHILSHPKGAVAGALSKLSKDTWGEAKWSNMEFRMNHWEGILHGKLSEALDAYRSKYAGLVQDKAGMRQFIRELYGESSGNQTARAASKAWDDTTEMARLAANAAGADIKKRSDWFMPNHHDQRRVRSSGQKAWAGFVQGLDIEVRDTETGMALSGDQLNDALATIWETISSGGMDTMTPGAGGARKLPNRLGDPRTLQFKDAKSWLAYNDAYGAGDIYGLVTGHVHAMARDIASMEVLGPNPDAMLRYIQDLALQDRVVRGKDGEGLGVGMIDSVYGHLSGRLSSPASELLARTFGGMRNLLSTAQLGRAPISALSDLKFLQQTSSWNGLDSTKVMKRYISQLNPANAADRAFAVRSGLIAESYVSKSLAAKRFQDDIVGDGWTARFANSFHRLSGLTPMTQAGRHAFGLEFLGFLADNAGHGFDDLPGALRKSFQRYGINASMWDVARRAELVDFKDAKFMRPENINAVEDIKAPEAARRLHEMILEETDFAVPTPDARTRAMLAGNTRRGTFWGEVVRSSTLYKSFSVTVMHTHMMRGAMATATGDKGMYLGSLLTGLTVMGAGVIGLKDIVKGRDPRRMDHPEFWGQAFAQGGGLGIFGDFLTAGFSRKDGTLMETLVGPVGGLVTDVTRLTSGNIRQAYEGQDPGAAAETVRFVKRYMPGTTMWYSSLAMERLVWNQLQIQADPNHARSFARMRRKAYQENGQEFWWNPGEVAPIRTPDFGNVRGK